MFHLIKTTKKVCVCVCAKKALPQLLFFLCCVTLRETGRGNLDRNNTFTQETKSNFGFQWEMEERELWENTRTRSLPKQSLVASVKLSEGIKNLSPQIIHRQWNEATKDTSNDSKAWDTEPWRDWKCSVEHINCLIAPRAPVLNAKGEVPQSKCQLVAMEAGRNSGREKQGWL